MAVPRSVDLWFGWFCQWQRWSLPAMSGEGTDWKGNGILGVGLLMDGWEPGKAHIMMPQSGTRELKRLPPAVIRTSGRIPVLPQPG